MTVEHMIPSLRANEKPYVTPHEITAANLSPIANPRRSARQGTWPEVGGLRVSHPSHHNTHTRTMAQASPGHSKTRMAGTSGFKPSSPTTSFALEQGQGAAGRAARDVPSLGRGGSARTRTRTRASQAGRSIPRPRPRRSAAPAATRSGPGGGP